MFIQTYRKSSKSCLANRVMLLWGFFGEGQVVVSLAVLICLGALLANSNQLAIRLEWFEYPPNLLHMSKCVYHVLVFRNAFFCNLLRHIEAVQDIRKIFMSILGEKQSTEIKLWDISGELRVVLRMVWRYFSRL